MNEQIIPMVTLIIFGNLFISIFIADPIKGVKFKDAFLGLFALELVAFGLMGVVMLIGWSIMELAT